MIDASQFLKEHGTRAPEDVSKKASPPLGGPAYRFALRSLCAAGASEKRLKERMIRKGFSEEETRKAVEDLKNSGFLSDRELARQIVEKCAKSMEGEALIRARLRKAGIGEEDARSAMREAESSMEEVREKFLEFLKEEAGGESRKALKICKKKGQPLGLALKIGASYTPGSVAP